MTYQVQELTAWHVRNIDPQDSQVDVFDPDEVETENGFALVDTETDEVFAVYVLIPSPVDPMRISAYTILSRNLGPKRLLYAAREGRRWLEEWGAFRRCEAYCPEFAIDEIHWCRHILKMELEGKLHSFFTDGQACYVFAKVK